jgi:hypothetical protein
MSVTTQAFMATQTPAAARTRYIGYNQAFSRIVTATGPGLAGGETVIK